MKARIIARYVTVTLMGLAVLVATGDGFAQSYSGLYGWGLEHGLHGWKADSFPLMVDLFVGIGEMGLFLIAIDGHRLRRSLLSWLDLLLPASIAAAGWTASLVFNAGHVKVHDFPTEATAAVPPRRGRTRRTSGVGSAPGTGLRGVRQRGTPRRGAEHSGHQEAAPHRSGQRARGTGVPGHAARTCRGQLGGARQAERPHIGAPGASRGPRVHHVLGGLDVRRVRPTSSCGLAAGRTSPAPR